MAHAYDVSISAILLEGLKLSKFQIPDLAKTLFPILWCLTNYQFFISLALNVWLSTAKLAKIFLYAKCPNTCLRKHHPSTHSFSTHRPELAHGRIETRTYHVYDRLNLIANKVKWGNNLTIVEYESDMVKKSTGTHATEKRLYMTNLPTDNTNIGVIAGRTER